MNSSETNGFRLGRGVAALALARVAVNAARRFAYPFLPGIARALDAPVAAVQAVVAVQEGAGLGSPLFGPAAEKHGRRRLMLASLGGMTGAALAGAFVPGFAVFAAVMIALGVGKIVYDPAMQAWLGDRVPYHRRALALGVTELSWAGGLLVAAPLTGLLLGGAGMRGVFLMLTGLLAAGTALVAVLVHRDPDGAAGGSSGAASLTEAWRVMRRSPGGRGALLFSLLLVGANEIFFINLAIWLERGFGLALTTLGVVAVAIGAAEIFGELLVVALADRLGKRRCAVVGAVVSGLVYLALPLVGGSLPLALAAMALLFVGFEVAVVASIPLFTEIIPGARAVMMTGNTGAHAAGRVAGAAIGGGLYAATGSFAPIGIVCAALGLGAAAVLLRFVRER